MNLRNSLLDLYHLCQVINVKLINNYFKQLVCESIFSLIFQLQLQSIAINIHTMFPETIS